MKTKPASREAHHRRLRTGRGDAPRVERGLWVLALLSTLACIRTTKPGTPTRPPSFVVLLADDLGWGDLGAHGNPHARTPNLDALAHTAVVFDDFGTAHAGVSHRHVG